MIDFDSEIPKSDIDISNIKDSDETYIILLAITILKEVNNILLELGMSGVTFFLEDLVADWKIKDSNTKKERAH